MLGIHTISVQDAVLLHLIKYDKMAMQQKAGKKEEGRGWERQTITAIIS